MKPYTKYIPDQDCIEHCTVEHKVVFKRAEKADESTISLPHANFEKNIAGTILLKPKGWFPFRLYFIITKDGQVKIHFSDNRQLDVECYLTEL